MNCDESAAMKITFLKCSTWETDLRDIMNVVDSDLQTCLSA